jgi:hypothetical protein
LKRHDRYEAEEEDERVVGGLGHVDMVVGVNGLLGAEFSTKDLDSLVGDDLSIPSTVLVDISFEH